MIIFAGQVLLIRENLLTPIASEEGVAEDGEDATASTPGRLQLFGLYADCQAKEA